MRISDWSSDVCSSDLLHVVDVQRAGRLVEQQPVLQVVVLGDGVGLARVEQVLLVDQHAQYGARADLKAHLRGVVRGVGRYHGQVTGFDLGESGHQGLVGVAGVALHHALERKSTRTNSSHYFVTRTPYSARKKKDKPQ